MNALARVLAPLVVGVSLAACGGGGGEEPGSAPVVATTTTTAPTSTPTPSPATTSTAPPPVAASPSPAPSSSTPAAAMSDCGLSNLPATVLQAINTRRAAGASCGTRGAYAATTALRWNTQLEAAALGHSTDMVTRNFFSHVSADGRSLAQRIDATGYAWQRIGENIAAGYASAEAVVAAWMASDGHCANLMNPAYVEIGLSCVLGTAANPHPNYWTLDFGTPR